MAMNLVSGRPHRTDQGLAKRVFRDTTADSTCFQQLPQLWFQQAEGAAAMAMAFFLCKGHLGEGQPRAADLEDRVVPETAVASRQGCDHAGTAAFHLEKHTFIGRCNAQGGAKTSASIGFTLQGVKQLFDALRVRWRIAG